HLVRARVPEGDAAGERLAPVDLQGAQFGTGAAPAEQEERKPHRGDRPRRTPPGRAHDTTSANRPLGEYNATVSPLTGSGPPPGAVGQLRRGEGTRATWLLLSP